MASLHNPKNSLPQLRDNLYPTTASSHLVPPSRLRGLLRAKSPQTTGRLLHSGECMPRCPTNKSCRESNLFNKVGLFEFVLTLAHLNQTEIKIFMRQLPPRANHSNFSHQCSQELLKSRSFR